MNFLQSSFWTIETSFLHTLHDIFTDSVNLDILYISCVLFFLLNSISVVKIWYL